MTSVGYYLVIAAIVVCLALMVKINRSDKAEREAYKAELSSQEAEEDLGNIVITKPTDAPADAAVRNTETVPTQEASGANSESEKSAE